MPGVWNQGGWCLPLMVRFFDFCLLVFCVSIFVALMGSLLSESYLYSLLCLGSLY